MTKVIRCTCGFLARGTDPAEAAATLDAHLRAEHPELAGEVRREDLEAMAEEA
jgi:predicted small metal-binding protein